MISIHKTTYNTIYARGHPFMISTRRGGRGEGSRKKGLNGSEVDPLRTEVDAKREGGGGLQ